MKRTRIENVCRLKVALMRDRDAVGEDIWRIIEIKASQTLERLHKTIFDAYDRFEEHLYSFYLSKDWRDHSLEYASPGLFEDDYDFPLGGRPHNASRTKIRDLGLRPGQIFYYVFDYGDYWQHEIKVLSIADSPTSGRYPRIVQGQGESPPQYDYADEGDYEDDDAADDEDGGRGRVIQLFARDDQ